MQDPFSNGIINIKSKNRYLYITSN